APDLLPLRGTLSCGDHVRCPSGGRPGGRDRGGRSRRAGVVGTVEGLGGRGPFELNSGPSLVASVRQDGHYARHRRAEVAVGVLDSALRPRRDGLIGAVEVRVEPAVVDERAGVVETQDDRATGGQELIRALMARRVEGVVAYHGVVVSVVVD